MYYLLLLTSFSLMIPFLSVCVCEYSFLFVLSSSDTLACEWRNASSERSISRLSLSRRRSLARCALWEGGCVRVIIVMVTYSSTSVTSAPRLLCLAEREESDAQHQPSRCLPDELLAAIAAILSLSICSSDISWLICS